MVVGGGVYGLRLLWRAILPVSGGQAVLTDRKGSPVRSMWDRALGWLLLLVAVVLFALMVYDRLHISGEVPSDWTTTPPMKGRAESPNRPY